MDEFCQPFAGEPFTGTFISVCFTDVLLFVLCALVLFGFGLSRVIKLRRLKPEARTYTKSHLFELILSLVTVIVVCINFIYLIVIKKGGIPLFKYLTTLAWAIVWVASLVLIEFEYQRGVKHNIALLAFWVLAATIGGLRIQAADYEGNLDLPETSLWFVVVELMCSVLLSLNALIYNDPPPSPGGDPDDYSLTDEKVPLMLEKRENNDGTEGKMAKPKCVPEHDAGFISRLTFSWLTPLLKKGFYTALIHDDLPACAIYDKVSDVANKFDDKWEEQQATGEISLVRTLWKTFWREFMLAALFKIGNDIFNFSGPLLLEQIVLFVQDQSRPMWQGILLAIAMFFGSTMQSIFMQQYWQLVYRISMRTKSALISKVYKKSLRLSHQERQKSTVGEITNLQSVDASAIAGIVVFLHQLWSAPLQILVSIALLWRVLNVASLGGLAVLAISSPLQIWVGRILADNQKEMMKKKDDRIKNTNEVLQGIRVIKFFAWEFSFMEKINDLRWKELVVLRKGAFIRTAIALIWTLTPLLVSLVSFAIFVAMGNPLTAEVAFSALALFNVMRFPLNILPSLITQLLEAQVSIGRLERFLCGDELDKEAVEFDLTSDFAVSVENGNFEWQQGKPILSDMNLNVLRGSLIAIVGEVGSGKSSLLLALLGEMPKTSGKVVVNGSVCYVPQNAWIKNATVKDNVIFLNQSDENRYNSVIKAAQLLPDIEILPAKDQTEIGEKGINLSGGQKQRVSMARALYANADVYMLDDPLSAVDSHVGRALFTECIKGILAGKTRILVTHQLQYLNQCDRIIVMKNGEIVEMGSYTELLNSGKGFSELITQYVRENENLADSDLVGRKDKQPELEIKQEKVEGAARGKPDGSHAGHGRPAGKPDGAPAGTGRPGGKPGGGPGAPQGTIIGAEGRDAGGVKAYVYLRYIDAIGGIAMALFIMLLYVAQTGAAMSADYWLSYWSVVYTDPLPPSPVNPAPMPQPMFPFVPMPEVSTARKLSELSEFGFGTEKIFDELGLGVYFYLMVYGIIGAITAALILSRSFLLAFAGINASKSIHGSMIDRVLRAPTEYFDTVPVGRILNRFSSDQNVIDNALPRTLGMAFDTVLTSLSVIFVIASVTPVFLISLISLSFLYRYAQKLYLRSSREIQRLSSIARSPIFALFGETLNGLSTIRAFAKEIAFQTENESRIQRANEAEYAGFTANRWLGIRLEFFGSVVVFAASFFAVIARYTIDPGLAGLSISYALRLTSNLNWLVRMSTDVENNLISVERCIQFTQLETEANFVGPIELSNWPDQGTIIFKDLKMRYREGLPLVLKGVNANIRSHEKIGICGRTGSGKSSLMLSLFRIVEPAEGSIIIDNQDIANLGLHDLRARLAIIPQDATLFTGTIRTNLDPFNLYSDDDIWKALADVEIIDQISNMGDQLESKVAEYGENLSVGTRQLLCLARALLKRSRILVMDEATANVDYATDVLIQKAIRKKFDDVTVLIIAHRINTILDCNRVIVLDSGTIVEFDTPQELLKNENSVFSGLAREAGLVGKKTVL